MNFNGGKLAVLMLSAIFVLAFAFTAQAMGMGGGGGMMGGGTKCQATPRWIIT